MPDDHGQDVASALFKVLGLAIGIGLAIGLVVMVMVKALGFTGDSHPAAHAAGSPDAPLSTLPTTALTPSGGPSASGSASANPTPSSSPTRMGKKIQLNASPLSVGSGQRINLTGTYPGQDNVQLQVQRKEAGHWTPFSTVQASVRVGSFGTYVMTSRTGVNVFRVFDTNTRTGSNPVRVTVG